MPRKTNGVAGQATAVLTFFRKASPESAELVLGLVRGIMKERKDNSAKIAAGQKKAAKVAAPAAAAPAAATKAPAAPKEVKKRKRNRGKNKVAAIAEATPGPGAGEDPAAGEGGLPLEPVEAAEGDEAPPAGIN